MSYTPLITILVLLVIGAAGTLTLLFYAHEQGYFDNLKSGAYVIFDEDEPVGEPQDQLFRETEDPSDDLDSHA
jgi:hypothetical protein